jgi:MFS family permease
MLLIPGLGDRFGHRPVAVVAVVVKLGALTMLILAPADVGWLFAVLFVVCMMGAGVTAVTVGPLTGSAVEAPLAVTATGFVIGMGEILGGALAPAVAGLLGDRFGIVIVPAFALGVTAIGLIALGAGGYRGERPARQPAGRMA